MPQHIPHHLLARLSEFVSSQLGLHFPEKRWRDLEHRTIHAAREFGFLDAGKCVQWLLSSPVSRSDIEILASHLTIGETYFFREKGSFYALESSILPELINARSGKEQRLRIWSAGCSSGEEAYSIAILLKKMIPNLDEWNITILATDVNPRALGKAAGGIYSNWSFRGVPEWMKSRYFNRCKDGRFEVPPAIRNMVTFANLNLVEDTYPSLVNNTNAMDIIFCRNVLMYFGAEQAGQVTGNFHRSLLDGGWLLVSPCETSAAIFGQFDTIAFPGAVFYRKCGDGKVTAAFSCPLSPGEPQPPQTEQQSTVSLPVPGEPLPPEIREETVCRAEPSAYEEAVELHRQGHYLQAAEKLCGYLSEARTTDATPQMSGKAAALLAQLFADMGNLTEALRWSEEAIAADKLNAELHYLRATIFQEQGAADDAVAALKRALYIDHTFVLSHFALGNLTLRQGKKTESDRHFDNALELLRTYCDDHPVPGSDGITAGRLARIIAATRESGRKP